MTKIADPSVGVCVAKAIGRWKFSERKGNASLSATVTYNLTWGV